MIGHVLRQNRNSHTNIALSWTPEGKRKRGRPEATWRRTVERERGTVRDSVHGMRQQRKLEAFCATRHEEATVDPTFYNKANCGLKHIFASKIINTHNIIVILSQRISFFVSTVAKL